MAEKDQLYTNMRQAALGFLQGRSPEEICRGGNISFRGRAFHLESLGQRVTVTYPDYQVLPKLPQWQELTLLHYLARADGTPLSGNLISFGQHRDGLVRGGGFDRDAEKAISGKLGRLPPETLLARARLLGGEIIPSNADLCVRFSYLPNYPVYLKVWFADEEFPASGRMLLDDSAPHYLTIEDAVTVGGLILEGLCDPHRSESISCFSET